jgi:cytochrome c5
MRLALTIFIYFVTVYQPAIAITADEDVTPVPYDNGYEQSATAVPELEAKVLSGVTRGQMLYENHCTSCHESMVYIRSKRKAKNYKEVANWVSQRADWLNLDWSVVEKHEVMQYLNERYYKYPLTE